MTDRTFIDRLNALDANFIIGVAGDSGSGKTTFTQGIRSILGPDLVSSFSLDDYHTEDREMRKESGNLPLDPAINDLELLAEHLQQLKKGKAIVKPVYDHSTGKFGKGVLFKPTRFVIIEGLHAMYTEQIRRSVDFAIYVDPIREVKWRWKMKRDVEKRGHKREDVEAEIRLREPYYKKFIDHQKIYADVVVKITPSHFDRERGVAVELVQIIPKIPLGGIDFHFDLSGIVRASEKQFRIEFKKEHYYGKPVTRTIFDGAIRHDAVVGLEKKIQEYTGLPEYVHFEAADGYIDAVAMTQLLICWRFLEKTDYLISELERAVG